MSEQELLKDFTTELDRFIEKLEHDRDYWKDLARHASRHFCDKEPCDLCTSLRLQFPGGRQPL